MYLIRLVLFSDRTWSDVLVGIGRRIITKIFDELVFEYILNVSCSWVLGTPIKC